MKLTSKTKASGSKSFAPIPQLEAGTYPAKVAQIVTLGKQYKRNWQTQEIETWDDGNLIIQEVMYISFEVEDEYVTIGDEQQPRWIGKEYTISLHEKSALTALLKMLKQDPSDNLENALGKGVLLTVGATSSGNAKISGVAGLMKGMTVSPVENAEKSFLFDFDEPDATKAALVPNFLRNKMKEATNYTGSACAKVLEALPEKPAYNKGGDKTSQAEKKTFSFDDDQDGDLPF